MSKIKQAILVVSAGLMGLGVAVLVSFQTITKFNDIDFGYENLSAIDSDLKAVGFDDNGEAVYANNDLIGRIRSDDVGLNMRLYKVSVQDTTRAMRYLDYGAIYDQNSSQFGANGFHYIQGHNMPTFGIKMDKLEIGNTLEIEIDGTIFAYEVRNKQIGAFNDPAFIRASTEGDEVLLSTCWPLDTVDTDERLWVRGVRI